MVLIDNYFNCMVLQCGQHPPDELSTVHSLMASSTPLIKVRTNPGEWSNRQFVSNNQSEYWPDWWILAGAKHDPV